MRTGLRVCSICVLYFGGSAQLAVLAQTATDKLPAAGETRVEEIVVTANRRSESIQKVPLAVSAISAQAAEQRGVGDVRSIVSVVPGVTVGSTLGSISPYIRGVGAPAADVSNEPSVATYVDNVYIPTGGATLFDFNNIERIEVLKGPQGTLFGRNATGGVLHVFTKDPQQQPAFDANVSYGNYDTLSGNFYGTTGLSDNLSANLALHATHRAQGWGRNLNTGRDVYTDSDYAGRAKLLWTPGNDTRVLVSFDGDYNTSPGAAARTPIPGTFANNGANPPVGYPGSFYDINETIEPKNKVRALNGSLQIDQGLGAVNFTSITAYRTLRVHTRYDLDVAPANLATTELFTHNDMFTQELQLKSAAESKLEWIVGGYFFVDSTGYNPQHVIQGGTLFQDTVSSVHSTSVASYAQAKVEVLPATHLTAGARYTVDRRGVKGTRTLNGVVNLVSRDSHTWDRMTWRAALDHQINDDLMVFASYNTGFKSGVYNLTSFSFPPAAPEILTAYEVGFKSDWFDRRLRINGSAFHYDYSNLQVLAIIAGPPISSFTVNAGKARVNGGELEITAVPTDRLTLNAGVSVLDTKYTEFKNGVHFSPKPLTTCANVAFPSSSPGGQNQVTNGGLGCDLSGNELVFAPPVTFNVAANYNLPTSYGIWGLSVSYFWSARYFFESDNSVRNDAYGLLNASVSWLNPTGKWGATVWGRNLTDSKYYALGASSSFAKYYSAAAPLTFGITLNVHLE